MERLYNKDFPSREQITTFRFEMVKDIRGWFHESNTLKIRNTRAYERVIHSSVLIIGMVNRSCYHLTPYRRVV